MKVKKEIFETPDAYADGVRINKYLADAGVCSRREGDKAIENGEITIDGVKATLGSRVLPGQKVTYKGKDISKIEELILIAFNKPVGIECTTDTRVEDNIISYIGYPKRIFPIGRLDKDSEGLILLTNDGNIVNKILRAGNNHEKEYIVTVNKDITEDFLKRMSQGVPILDTVTRPCTVEQIDRLTFKIVLTQGLNRQIRRMCEALDYRVRFLQRVRIMNINIGRLKVGTYRNLTDLELNGLRELIADSTNAPMAEEIHRDKTTATRANNMSASGAVTAKKSKSDRFTAANKAAFAKSNKAKTRTGSMSRLQKIEKSLKSEQKYDIRTEKKSNRGTDKAAVGGGKSLRAGRQGADK